MKQNRRSSQPSPPRSALKKTSPKNTSKNSKHSSKSGGASPKSPNTDVKSASKSPRSPVLESAIKTVNAPADGMSTIKQARTVKMFSTAESIYSSQQEIDSHLDPHSTVRSPTTQTATTTPTKFYPGKTQAKPQPGRKFQLAHITSDQIITMTALAMYYILLIGISVLLGLALKTTNKETAACSTAMCQGWV